MFDNNDLDAQRLLHLARARDTRRAYARQLSDRYQDLREARQGVQRRMQVAQMNAHGNQGRHRFEAEGQIKALASEIEDLTAQMGETQAEADAVAQEAGEAAQVLRSCLQFAHGRGLAIPPQLAQEARPATFAPLSATIGASS